MKSLPPFPGAGAILASLMSDISGCSPTVPPLSAEISLSSDPSCWCLSQPIPDLGEGGAWPPLLPHKGPAGGWGVAGCYKWDGGQSFVEGRKTWGGAGEKKEEAQTDRQVDTLRKAPHT